MDDEKSWRVCANRSLGGGFSRRYVTELNGYLVCEIGRD